MNAQTESNLLDNGKTEQSENLPYVTLLIPMRNEEGNIDRCLDSVLSNDYPHDKTELLIIDGLSTDRSADIVRGYAEKYPWLRIISNPRQIRQRHSIWDFAKLKGKASYVWTPILSMKVITSPGASLSW